MTVKELYERIGGDYDAALKRLMMDKLISKFILRFLDDTSCNDIVTAWEKGDEEAVFEASHGAKGVCANLELTRLKELASTITEATRPGNEELKARTDLDAAISELHQVYEETIQAIHEFAEEQ